MNIHGVSFYSEQLKLLRSEVEKEKLGLAPEEKESIAATRLDQAAAFVVEAEFNLEEFKRGNFVAAYELIRALVSAQVELDYFNNPEVDPFIGWIKVTEEKRSDGREFSVLDTQLYRTYLDLRSATPVSFQYKPRKLDLMSGVWEDGGVLSICQRAFDLSAKTALTPAGAERLILRNGFDVPPRDPKVQTKIRTKDLIRFCLSSGLESGKGREYRDLVFKAGVGAHLSNATAGVSIEHWVEMGPELPTQMVCLQLNLGLPTKDVELISVRPLTAFGGVSERVLKFSPNIFIKSSDEPAGVHGTRLIDGLGSLVIDIRSAKPLNAASVIAELNGGAAKGLIVQFFIDARRINGDDKANMVFISIT